ncbi:MAG TPA: hypothetical protein VH105_09270 [Burkholderiales bacterium]|jgi:hypothetical protein|nr:hypothetical protein [Burkholderiales bacterium]
MLIDEGWKAFSADEQALNDGEESCVAKLHLYLNDSWVGALIGSTRNNRGHAEMDTLFQYLGVLKENKQVFGTHKLVMECLDKACCVKCAAILGLLGVGATSKTFKSKKTMGKTGYAIHPELRTFIAKTKKITETKLCEELLDISGGIK